MDRSAPATPVHVERTAHQGDIVAQILATLPAWFGIEESNREYAAAAAKLPNYVAHHEPGVPHHEPGTAVGIALVDRLFDHSAELHLIAVRPEWHGHGVGTALLTVIEQDLVREGVPLLSVKTLGPSSPDAAYAKTRGFYAAHGFLPVEEFEDLWPGQPCLLMVKPLPAAAV